MSLGSDPATQLDGFIANYSPEIATLAREILKTMRRRLPHAFELVYDNYNALAVGFGPDERTSLAIFSIALYPKWVSLFFLQASRLSDPNHLLKGSGKVAKHVVLPSARALDEPEIMSLMEQALSVAKVPLSPDAKPKLLIKSVSANQRPRRPS